MLRQTRRTRRACASNSRGSASLAARVPLGSNVGALVVAASVPLAVTVTVAGRGGRGRRGRRAGVVAAPVPLRAAVAGALTGVRVRSVVATRARSRPGVGRLAFG